jgi:hypothetical protein
MKGYCEGDICGRDDCQGSIQTRPVENCSCHISPPCSACTSPRNFCPICGWEESEDVEMIQQNDHIIKVDKSTGVWKSLQLRPLDPTKIDWHSVGHTHFTMIKRGVYPEGTTAAEVLEVVKGTFGGRFNYFGNGKFEYVAYTD